MKSAQFQLPRLGLASAIFALVLAFLPNPLAAHDSQDLCARLLGAPFTYTLTEGEDAESAYKRILAEAAARGHVAPATVRILTPEGKTAGVWNRDIRYIMTNRSLDFLSFHFQYGEIDSLPRASTPAVSTFR